MIVIKSVRSRHLSMPMIVLSAKRSVEDRVECLESGADDYLGKPFAFTELLARLHALLRRPQTLAEPSSLEAAGIRLDLLHRRVERDGKPIDLQPREFALLEHLMRSGRLGRLCIVATARDEPSDRTEAFVTSLGSWARLPGAERVSIARFDALDLHILDEKSYMLTL